MDKADEMAFVGMLIEQLAHNLNVPLEKLTDWLIVGIKNNPMEFGVKKGDSK